MDNSQGVISSSLGVGQGANNSPP